MAPNGPFDTDLLSSPDADSPPGTDTRRRRPPRSAVVAVITLLLLAAGATGVALAADSSTPTPSKTGSPGAGERGHRFGLRGPGELEIRGPMGAVHGEFVVPKRGGGYQTVVVQRGTVTSVSTASISVKSADGYTASYAVTADTWVNATRDGITSIDKGAEVTVLAQKKAGGLTATRVADLSRWAGLRGRGRGGDASPAPAAPSAGATTRSSGYRV